MNTFRRLSRFGGTVKARAVPIWRIVAAHLTHWWKWLDAPREPVEWQTIVKVATALRLPTIAHRLLASAAVVVVLAIFVPIAWRWYSDERIINGAVTYPHASLANPVVAGVGAVLLIWAAIRQARTATKQTAIAAQRHFAQTEADRQRRITESFAKAIEQLGSDKLEVRLGGIYSLERISKESPDDYWTVMENLTAFVRERSRRNEAERTLQDLEHRISRRAYFLWCEAGQPSGRAEAFWADAVKQEELGEPPPADIAAVLMVVRWRREPSSDKDSDNRPLNFNGAILKRAYLSDVDLEGALFGHAHLEGAALSHAHLERAVLIYAHLKRADLVGAQLRGAYLNNAHLEGADLRGAELEGANLFGAHLKGADFRGTHVEGVDLSCVRGLSQTQITEALGDAETALPTWLTRPEHWPSSMSPNV